MIRSMIAYSQLVKGSCEKKETCWPTIVVNRNHYHWDQQAFTFHRRIIIIVHTIHGPSSTWCKCDICSNCASLTSPHSHLEILQLSYSGIWMQVYTQLLVSSTFSPSHFEKLPLSCADLHLLLQILVATRRSRLVIRCRIRAAVTPAPPSLGSRLLSHTFFYSHSQNITGGDKCCWEWLASLVDSTYY